MIRSVRRARIRRRRLVAALAAGGVVVAAVLWFVVWRDPGAERVCGRIDDLVRDGSVRLVADAMDAFHQAEAAAGDIEVVESYRSCREQAAACERICGSRRGCPGTCAPPGLSWHQRGEAVDVTQEMLDRPGVIEALEEAGWCQSLPDTDPGHFSWDGCH